MIADPEVLGANETADVLRISRSTLSRLMREGRIAPVNDFNPNLKRPRRLLFRRADVERLAQPIQRAG